MSKMTKISTYVAGAAMAASLALPIATQARASANTTLTHRQIPHKIPIKHSRGISGTVSAISGTTITLTSTHPTSTTYTVDASLAKLLGGMMGGTLPLSDILVGDKITVHGTVSGTTVTGTSITDNSLMGRNIFSGRVTAISGSTITIAGMKGTSWTIDASLATIMSGFGKNATTTTIGDIKIGDHLTAIGSTNGSNVTATSIFDLSVRKKMELPESNRGMMPKNAAAGKVTAISGSTITINGMMGKTITIDASSATVTKGMGMNPATSTVGTIAIGDYVTAQGTLSGTTVSATSVRDFGVMPSAPMNWSKKH
ncbi:MAG: DUF5666 domain-containing protein [Patescibacteria group bacterium]